MFKQILIIHLPQHKNKLTMLKKKMRKIPGIWDNEKLVLTPTQRRIYMMSDYMLKKHYALIFHKVSKSLSAEERRLITSRVEYRVRTKAITQDEVFTEVLKVYDIIKE